LMRFVCVASFFGLIALGCGAEAAKDPSYLLVEIVPADTAPNPPKAARVVVTNATTDAEIASLCINTTGEPGKPVASFVLKRDVDKPATDRITIKVFAYDSLGGLDTVDPGKDFVCPGTLPPPLVAEPQSITVDFCEAQTRRLVVHLAAVCGCADADAGAADAGACGCGAGTTCGVGVSTSGKVCDSSSCCAEVISSACALDL
jgi:hypothetical protein